MTVSDQVVLLAAGGPRTGAAGALVGHAGELTCALAAGKAELRPLRVAGVPVRSL